MHTLTRYWSQLSTAEERSASATTEAVRDGGLRVVVDTAAFTQAVP